MEMKKLVSITLLCAVMSIASFSCVKSAIAEELKMVGSITKIVMAPDGTSATATLKDSKTSEEVSVIVGDELTLDKFKDKRIVEGDEIRCKYDKEGVVNTSRIFRKTAGC